MRVMVTGSRDWEDRLEVYRQLYGVCVEFDLNYPDDMGFTMPDSRKITVVHGHCPTGADHWADEWCITNNFMAERHPADWKHWGRLAGPVRNRQMIETEPDIVLAFLMPCAREVCLPYPHGSHGTQNAINLAGEFGIRTRIFTPEGEI